MKVNTHPQNYKNALITCSSCNTEYRISSTIETYNVEVCSNCHPFYTGQAGIILDTYDRVDKFKKQADSVDKEKLMMKKKKKTERSNKTSEVNAGPKLTLKDMLKQANSK